MCAHTCFLVFTKHQQKSPEWDRHIKLGTRERKQYAAKMKRLGLDAEEEQDFDENGIQEE